MNKKDLIGRIAVEANISRLQAARAVDCFVESVQSSLVKGDRVTLSGFGTFAVSHRKARMVRDPDGQIDRHYAIDVKTLVPCLRLNGRPFGVAVGQKQEPDGRWHPVAPVRFCGPGAPGPGRLPECETAR